MTQKVHIKCILKTIIFLPTPVPSGYNGQNRQLSNRQHQSQIVLKAIIFLPTSKWSFQLPCSFAAGKKGDYETLEFLQLFIQNFSALLKIKMLLVIYLDSAVHERVSWAGSILQLFLGIASSHLDRNRKHIALVPSHARTLCAMIIRHGLVDP